MSDTKGEQKTPFKASAGDDASKVKLLVSCIKHKTNDTINWQAVAEECEILGTDGAPSKGAASKRYDRILKAYNVDKPVSSKGAAANGENGASTPKKKATPRKKAAKDSAGEEEESPSKKRKVSAVKEETLEDGEGEAMKAEQDDSV